MIERKQGHLVSMSSIAGAMGCEVMEIENILKYFVNLFFLLILFDFQNVVPYSASKFAVRGMMEALTEVGFLLAVLVVFQSW